MINMNDLKMKDKNDRQRENAKVLDKIVKFLTDTAPKDEILIFKNWGSIVGRAGRPDLEIVYNSNTWYIECKDEKGSASTLQIDKIDKFNRAGVKIYVVNDVKYFIEKIWPIMNQ